MRLFSFLVVLLISPNTYSKDPDLSRVFQALPATSTMVIASLDGEALYVHNPKRARQAFSAASTFKIPNTLIALEEGVVADSESVFKWDGVNRSYAAWNRDQTLKSAYQLSCVWCYQQIASQVGEQTYRRYLTDMPYGTLKDEFDATSFWLGDSLTVSAWEQIRFLKQVYQETLPFQPAAYQTLKDIMVEEANDKFVLRAKTGWSTEVAPQVGWYVGWLELKDSVWFFAMNLEVQHTSDLALRKRLTLEALKTKGIL